MDGSKPAPIWQDKREIEGIFEISLPEDEAVTFWVGMDDVTKIVAYPEDGIKDGDVAWFAVYKGEEIAARVPAWGFGVYYKGVEEEGGEEVGDGQE